MSSLPSPAVHSWVDLSVGGSSNDPTVLHLDEENLIANGSFEEALSGWSNEAGTAPSRVDLGSEAEKGNYVMRLQASSTTHKSIAFTGTKILLTGWLRFKSVSTGKSASIVLYITNSSDYVSAPASKFVKVQINSVDANVNATSYFLPFYLALDAAAGTYAHINISTEAGVDIYLDNFRVHEINNIVELNAPNILTLRHALIKDAEYEMFDGTQKMFVRGWRPIYRIGYDFIDAAGLVKNIGLTESLFNFFIPHSNNLAGSYVRSASDFSPEPFHGRFLGHSNELELTGIFVQKFKAREFGSSYFAVTAG